MPRSGDEDIPDWLLGVKKSVDEEAQAAKLAASQPASDNVDWFQRLQEDQKAAKGEDASQWPGFYNEPPGFGKIGQDEPLISQSRIRRTGSCPPPREKAPETAERHVPPG